MRLLCRGWQTFVCTPIKSLDPVYWHAADHYGQMTLYLRENGIVPPASSPHPLEIQNAY